MSVKNNELNGDTSIGRNLTVGGNGTVRGNVRIGKNLKVDGWLDAPNIKSFLKGLFATAGVLNERYPNPQNGWAALVGDTLPAELYVAQGGEWVNTGKTAGEISIEHDDFDKRFEEIEQEVAAIRTELPEMMDQKISNATSDTISHYYVDRDTDEKLEGYSYEASGKGSEGRVLSQAAACFYLDKKIEWANVKKVQLTSADKHWNSWVYSAGYTESRFVDLEQKIEDAQLEITMDTKPTLGSNNAVTSDGIRRAIVSTTSTLNSTIQSIHDELEFTKFAVSNIVQETGEGTAKVMSQKAVSDELSKKVDLAEVVERIDAQGEKSSEELAEALTRNSLYIDKLGGRWNNIYNKGDVLFTSKEYGWGQTLKIILDAGEAKIYLTSGQVYKTLEGADDYSYITLPSGFDRLEVTEDDTAVTAEITDPAILVAGDTLEFKEQRIEAMFATAQKFLGNTYGTFGAGSKVLTADDIETGWSKIKVTLFVTQKNTGILGYDADGKRINMQFEAIGYQPGDVVKFDEVSVPSNFGYLQVSAAYGPEACVLIEDNAFSPLMLHNRIKDLEGKVKELQSPGTGTSDTTDNGNTTTADGTIKTGESAITD